MVGYSTALSHIVLAGTGIYCLTTVRGKDLTFAKCSFGIIALNSIIGVWRWGNPSYGDKVEKFYKFTSELQDLLALPCIVTTIWLSYNYSLEMAYAHTFVCILPFLSYMYDSEDTSLMDVLTLGNCMSLGLLSYWHENYFGIAAAFSYTLSYFCIKRDVNVNLPSSNLEIPTQDLYNYSMCFFTFFALRAVLD